MKLTEKKLRSIIREELKRESVRAQLDHYSISEDSLMRFYDTLEELGVKRTDDGRFAFLVLDDVTSRVIDIEETGGSVKVEFNAGSKKMPGTMNTSQTITAPNPERAARKVMNAMKRRSYT